jgi:hypothetical protein
MLIAGCIIPVADPGASIPRLVASKCRKNRHISTALPTIWNASRKTLQRDGGGLHLSRLVI